MKVEPKVEPKLEDKPPVRLIPLPEKYRNEYEKAGNIVFVFRVDGIVG